MRYTGSMAKNIILIALIILVALGTGYFISSKQSGGNASNGQAAQTSPSKSETSGTTLDLSGQQLTSLPDSVLSRSDITVLNVSNNQLAVLPADIAKLTNLTVLNIENNRLEGLPKELTQMKNLREIRANNNRIKSLPGELEGMTFLKFLDISGNRLSEEQAQQIQSSLPDTEVKL